MGFSLKVKKVESLEVWDFKFTVTVVLFYFLVLYPAVQFFFRGHPWWPQYAYLTFLTGVLLYVLGIKKIPLRQSGFSTQYIGNHLIIGLVSGGLIVAALPLLDVLISVSGLDKHELFSESINQRRAEGGEVFHPLRILGQILLVPLLKQFFFTAGVFQSLNRKYNSVLAIYGTAVIFTLADFQWSLGLFTLGLITAFLFQLTGTLYASILFHASCSLAGALLLHVYPRLTTLLVFLF